MPPVFAHGRLRLYLLGLLDEAPRHGYEVIRLLEERFQGLYAPSAGTVYPRLAKLEAEGLVTHATEGGRKVYSITDAGREELAGRSGELADLELEIRESVSELAAEIRADVRGAAGDLRREMRAAASETRRESASAGGDWKEQARRAKDESRRAREDAQQARRQAQEAHEQARQEMQRLAKRVQDRFARGDWPTSVREGLADITKEFGRFGRPAPEPGPEPEWAHEDSSGNPARDLDRLLDRFRDDIRDAARDHGVTDAQLQEARRHLSAAAAHISAALRGAP
ncbi:helix-turn-helix transcriptional regulator [Streptomyces sp. A3M-1-3]|uniref:PadR family transcriptional regulator n=1 Tax=Streptomyces sp. A3M-1-3 TaxID=2962044 RepID=UPI0020B89C12|nr:helix-turn-helix transcriptional regulator [Streptomyces sp. A3M-1-3]MCP3821744.1 helix-turn-helix transcriptional regulator [Streptomyces sp. A3M-1-3]